MHKNDPYMNLFFFFLLSVSWGTLQTNQWEHQSEGSVVVYRPDADPGGHWFLANETSQELLWGQEISIELYLDFLKIVIVSWYSTHKILKIACFMCGQDCWKLNMLSVQFPP